MLTLKREASDVELPQEAVGKIDLFITISEDFCPRDDDSLRVSKGQVLRYLEQTGSWVLAADVYGRAGYVPAACCRLESSGALHDIGFDSDAIAAVQQAEVQRLSSALQKPVLASRLSLKASLGQRIEDFDTNDKLSADKTATASPKYDATAVLKESDKPCRPQQCHPLKKFLHLPKQSKHSLFSFKESCCKVANKAIKVARKSNGHKCRVYYTTERQDEGQDQRVSDATVNEKKLEARSPTTGNIPMPSVQEHAAHKLQSADCVGKETSAGSSPTGRRSALSERQSGKRRGHSVTFSDSVSESTFHSQYENIPNCIARYENIGSCQDVRQTDQQQQQDNQFQCSTDAKYDIMQTATFNTSPVAGNRSSECFATRDQSVAYMSGTPGSLQRPSCAKPCVPSGVYHSAPTTRATSPDFRRGRLGPSSRPRPRPIIGSLEYYQASVHDPLASDMATFQPRQASERFNRDCPDETATTGKRRAVRVASDTHRVFAQRSFSNELEYRRSGDSEPAPRPSNFQLRAQNGHSVVSRAMSVPAILQPTYIALFDFPATQKPLLSTATGDVLQRCSPEVDDEKSVWCGYAKGWRYVRNPVTGNIGYVPSEILQPYRPGSVHGVSTTQL